MTCEGPAWSAVDDHGLLTSEVLYQLSYGGGVLRFERVAPPRAQALPSRSSIQAWTSANTRSSSGSWWTSWNRPS